MLVVARGGALESSLSAGWRCREGMLWETLHRSCWREVHGQHCPVESTCDSDVGDAVGAHSEKVRELRRFVEGQWDGQVMSKIRVSLANSAPCLQSHVLTMSKIMCCSLVIAACKLLHAAVERAGSQRKNRASIGQSQRSLARIHAYQPRFGRHTNRH